MPKRSLRDYFLSSYVPVAVPQDLDEESKKTSMRALSKQIKGVTGRPGRTSILRSSHFQEQPLGFEAAAQQNIASGGQPPRGMERPPAIPKTPKFGGGPGVGAAEGVDVTGGLGLGETTITPGPPQSAIEAAVSNMVGNAVVGRSVGKGLASSAMTGIVGHQMGFPMSEVAPVAVESGMRSMAAPFGLGLMGLNMATAIPAGKDALDAANAVYAITGREDLAIDHAENVFASQPHSFLQSITSPVKSALGLDPTTSPHTEGDPFYSEFSTYAVPEGGVPKIQPTQHIAPQTQHIASAIGADIGVPGAEDFAPSPVSAFPGEGLISSESSMMLDPEFEPDFAKSYVTGSLATLSQVPQSHAYTVAGGGIQGVTPTGQSGMGPIGQTPTGREGGGLSPYGGQGGGMESIAESVAVSPPTGRGDDVGGGPGAK